MKMERLLTLEKNLVKRRMTKIEQKKNLRKQMLSVRGDLSEAYRIQASKKIWEKIYELPMYQNAETVYLYLSYQSEVDTLQQIARILQDKKKLAVPKVTSERQMTFFYIRGMMDVRSGYRGILEPVTTQEADGTEGILLVPGTAFDKKLYRMGYGGGFYDTYMKQHAGLCRIGMSFACQVVEALPLEDHDERLTGIVTENRTLF